MAIQPVQRNPITAVPPLRLAGEGLPDILEKWLPQLLPVTYKTRIDTRSDVKAASGATTNILILPPSRGLWFVTINIGPVGDAANYQACALVFTDGNTARMFQIWNGPLQVISLSGMTIQSLQSSGSAQELNATAIQLTYF